MLIKFHSWKLVRLKIVSHAYISAKYTINVVDANIISAQIKILNLCYRGLIKKENICPFRFEINC